MINSVSYLTEHPRKRPVESLFYKVLPPGGSKVLRVNSVKKQSILCRSPAGGNVLKMGS